MPQDYKTLANTHGGVSFPNEEALPDFSDVPAFLKNSIDMKQVKQGVTAPQNEEDRQSISFVDTQKPYQINVVSPDLYGPPILNHELTHTFQYTRNPELRNISSPIKGVNVYDYGGLA